MSSDAWICPACTLRQPKAGLCMFCGAPSPESTTDEGCDCATFDTGENLNQEILRKRRQFIASRIRAEFPNLNDGGFDVELIRNARKKVRQFVFGENASHPITPYERSVLLQHCLDELFGYGPLGPIVRDPEVREIKVYSKDLTMVRKKTDEFENASITFDDNSHLHGLIDIVKARSSPVAWRDLAQAYFEHYVTWDGIKISVSQIPVPSGTPYMTFLFQEPLGSHAISSDRESLEEGVSSVKPLENQRLINQKKQFVCAHIRKEFPKWNSEDVEKLRKKIRQLVFNDSTESRLTPYEKTVLYQDCLDEMFGFGPLGPLLRDPDISEIRVFDPERTSVKRRGSFESMTVMFDDESHLRRIVNLLASQSQPRDTDNKAIDEYITPTGSRVVVTRSPLSSDDPYLVINHEGVL